MAGLAGVKSTRRDHRLAEFMVYMAFMPEECFRSRYPIVGFLVLMGVVEAYPQEQTNPVAGDGTAIQEGASLFHANCSPCHGLKAQGGGRGPDLTSGAWNHGSSDRAIFQTISQGVAGTEMPANTFEDSETWALVAFLRSVSLRTPVAIGGDPAKGEQIFTGKAACAHCHMVKGRGGHLGPDLTRVGAARSLDYLKESIREPDKELSLNMSDPENHYGIPSEYESVTVTLRDGTHITGVAKNEDVFSIQLLGLDDQIHLFVKKDLSTILHERRSLMPTYTEQVLNKRELEDLLSYLSTLRGE